MSTALILSGGALRGAAHIGVLRRLEELGIHKDIKFVTGASAGSIIAALIAIGWNSSLIADFFKKSATAQNMFDLDIVGLIKGIKNPKTIQGIFAGEKIGRILESTLGKYKFESCWTAKLAIVATDVDTGEGKIFHEGPLVPAIRASMAIPAIYKPIVIDGQQYVDGGLSDNVPIRALNTLEGIHSTQVLAKGLEVKPIEIDRVIVVNLGAFFISTKATGIVDYLCNSFNIIGSSLTNQCLLSSKWADKVINIDPVTVGNAFDFKRIDYFIEQGYDKAKGVLG